MGPFVCLGHSHGASGVMQLLSTPAPCRLSHRPQLAELPALRRLELSARRAPSAEFKALSRLTSLTCLHLLVNWWRRQAAAHELTLGAVPPGKLHGHALAGFPSPLRRDMLTCRRAWGSLPGCASSSASLLVPPPAGDPPPAAGGLQRRTSHQTPGLPLPAGTRASSATQPTPRRRRLRCRSRCPGCST